MITVLEGPDASGKTTLSKMGFPDSQYVHLGPPPEKKFQPRDEYDARAFPAWLQYMTEVFKCCSGNHQMLPFVYDRLMYGELVYGPILRPKETQLNWVHVRMLERVLLAHQTVLIACQLPFETAVELWKEKKLMRDELIDNVEQFTLIWSMYLELWQKVSLPLVMYDFTKDTIEATVAYADARRTPRNHGPGIGNYKDGVTLLVGEQVNGKVEVNGWPFVSLGGSSYWLTEQLMQAGVCEEDLYWINSLDPAGRVTSSDFLKPTDDLMKQGEILTPGKVIAMGKAAEIWCAKAGLKDVIPVPHPAFWKRFHYSEAYQLIEELL